MFLEGRAEPRSESVLFELPMLNWISTVLIRGANQAFGYQ